MLPTNIEPVAILPVGYKNQEPSHLHDTRNPIDHFLI